ncbi:hypothetical protein CHCC14821_0974 [Bacillus paralicheniformis]|nr:hypothetical protein CHCC14821_0974 [Bacillus paralicheniformis]TWM61154.1 hypothetical protein CHCC14814_0697 [Bacillus paralicheniformis]
MRILFLSIRNFKNLIHFNITSPLTIKCGSREKTAAKSS